MTPEEIAAGLSHELSRSLDAVLFGSNIYLSPAIMELNAMELVHLDVVKASNGNIRKWSGRLTPLGYRVYDAAHPPERPDHDRS